MSSLSAQDKKAAEALSEEMVQELMDQLEATSLDDAVKAQYSEKLSEALDFVKKSASMGERATYLRESINEAPVENERLAAELESLPPPNTVGELPVVDEVDDLRELVDAGRADLVDIETEYTGLDIELSNLRGRPLESGKRLTEVRTELTEVDGRLAGFPVEVKSPSKVSERALLLAKQSALKAELEMLKQERLSQVAREQLQQTKRDLALRKRSLARAGQSAIEDLLKVALAGEAELVESRVDELEVRTDLNDPRQTALLQDLRLLSDYYSQTTTDLEWASEEYTKLSQELDVLSRNFLKVQDQVAVGAYDGALAQILLVQRRTLPNPRVFSYSIEARQERLGELRRLSLKVEDMRREGRVLDSTPLEDAEPIYQEMLSERRELIEGTRKNLRALTQQLSILDADERAYRDLLIKFRDFLTDKMFWLKSSPPLDETWPEDIKVGSRWVFKPSFWKIGWDSICGIPGRHPWWMVLLILCVGSLMLCRSRLVKAIKESGEQTRRISTDRYTHTLKALFYTHLVSLPVPLLIGFVGWGLVRDPGGGDWVRGVGRGMVWTAVIVGTVSFFRNACRRGGLCELHLGWGRKETKSFSRLLLLIFLIEVPAMVVLSATLYEDSARPFNGLGRLCFMLSLLWMAGLFAYYLNPSKRNLSSGSDFGPKWWLNRFKYVWYPLLVIVPVALVVLAGIGYATTAIALSFAFLTSLTIALGGCLVHALILRWFLIKERRLALDEAIEQRRERANSGARGGDPDVSEEDVQAEEAAMDLDSIGVQTRRLLRSISIVGVILVIWWQWSMALPVDTAMNRASLSEGFSFLVLMQVVLIVSIGTVVIRNLPGLMELAGLRDSTMDPGTRYAVATIAQYVLSVVLAFLVFRLIELDWSHFGWIAAALSVGLGFGLQEVVANFVCGVILLFERPIRVGDVVVINDISGTVTRIRMRATTITNWDREDLVVPNKEFITGSLVNCTLSNKINRFVAKVGVAYGSDVGEALRILDEIAKLNPLIMDDPGPVTTFEGFGDSTLDLSLRCYLANRDNRLGVITEVHSEINRRFKEGGLEIAFPQRDLHLRSVDVAARGLLKGEEA